eukprot:sb/3471411/
MKRQVTTVTNVQQITTHTHIEQAQYLAILRLDIGLRYRQDIVGSLLPTCHVHRAFINPERTSLGVDTGYHKLTPPRPKQTPTPSYTAAAPRHSLYGIHSNFPWWWKGGGINTLVHVSLSPSLYLSISLSLPLSLSLSPSLSLLSNYQLIPTTAVQALRIAPPRPTFQSHQLLELNGNIATRLLS